MRIGITSNTLKFGGAERQRVMLANGLAALGHHVELLLIQAGGPLEAAVNDAVRVRRVRAAAPALRSRYDALVTGLTNTEAAYALRTLGRSRWAAASHAWPSGQGPLYRRPLRAAVRRADAVVALTARHAQELQRSDGLRDAVVIPNGTDLAVAPPRPKRTGGAFRLGFVGRLTPVKGCDRLLRVLADLDPSRWSLDVYGDGPERPQLEAFASARRLPVRWNGWTTGVTDVLDSLDALVIPSRSEAVPMVALEAMARRCPVVAAPVGGLPEMLLGGRAGVLLDASPVQWAPAVGSLVTGALQTGHLVEAAVRMVEQEATAAIMISRYEELACSLAGKRP